MLCPNCGQENPEGFRFCGYCSTPLETEAASRQEVRKTVTILFCDVTGSTTLGERLDPETVRRVMSRYFDEMRSVLESHGGTVEKFIGDAVMAVFGVPIVHEDDALRAVRAASEMRERLHTLNKELERDHAVSIEVRIGVNTGEVVAGTNAQTLATGDAVNVAARLEQAASTGEILIGADTHRLVRDAVEVEPVEPVQAKGKAKAIAAFRLISAEGPEGLARRFEVPIVGRVDELRALADGLRRAERDRACVLATVLGPAGVGKSRLVKEFLERAAPTSTLVRGRCLPYGEGITYWPIVEIVTSAAGILDVDGPDEIREKIAARLSGVDDADLIVQRLAQLLGVTGAAAAPDETHWAVRKLLETMASSGPLVVLIEDIHWAGSSLLELIEHIADWSRGAPILLLCTARPELLDQRSAWGGGKLNATSFLLEPLSDAECDELVVNLLDHARLPEDARRSIIGAAEGNPLFVEQMVAMLIDKRLLQRDGEGWVVRGDLAGAAPPTSITALLEARLERLELDERVVIERASIEGKQFHSGSVAALAPDVASVSRALMALVRRDLIRPERSSFSGEEGFRFRHILIRDAAYNRIPKGTRAELHERHADWLERIAGDRLAEFEEIVGFHVEQAYRLRTGLGPHDEAAAELASRAARHLLSSARRAAERGDVRASSNLLSRTIDLLPVADPERPRLLTDLSLQLAEAGQPERARAAVESAEATIGPQPDPGLDIAIRFAHLSLDSAMQPEGVARRMKEEAERAIPRLEGLRDDVGLSRAWTLIGEAHNFWGNNAEMLIAFGRALDHAERSGDRVAAADAAVWCMIATVLGMTPPSEGLPSIEAIAGRVPDHVEVAAWQQSTRGLFLAMLGQVDEGRSLVRKGRETFEDLGRALTLGGSSMIAGLLEEIAGDLETSEGEIRRGYELLASLGEKGYLSTAVSRLARLVARRGDVEGASELAQIGMDASASDDVFSQVAWRQAVALVHAGRAEHDRALVFAKEAVELAASTDDFEILTSTQEDLSEVHRLADRYDKAAEALARAIATWDRKGAVFVADRLRARIAELRGP